MFVVINMGKYDLVASYHDGNGNFYNERIIRIDGIKLDTLANIDFYTSGMKEDEVWREISKACDLNDCNLLSIRYLGNDSRRPLYYKVLYSNPSINSCSVDLKLKAGKDRKHSYFINKNNKYFQQELEKLENLIKNKDIDKIKERMSDNQHLAFLIKRYIDNGDVYEDYDAKKLAYDDIVAEFSKYINFRKWIISGIRKVYDRKSIYSTKNNSKHKYNYKHVPNGKEDNFYEQLSIERQRILDSYNIGNLEKEEYLSESELEQMGYGIDPVMAEMIKKREDALKKVKKKPTKLSYEEE